MATHTAELSVEDGWRELLERGRLFKKNALASGEFLSPAALGKQTGQSEADIRRQVANRTLFAVQAEDGQPKIPVWAYGIAGNVTESILQEAATADAWHLYHFLNTPLGRLNGLRPVELLRPDEGPSSAQKAARQELIDYFGLSDENDDRLNLVLQALKADLNEDGWTWPPHRSHRASR